MKDTSPSLVSMSYSFVMRGELPGDMGLFYQDAGTARDAFNAARRDLPGQTFPKQHDPNSARSDSASAQKYRTPQQVLPDPHPSFAQPNRKLRDETWFQELRTREDGRAMTKEEFMAARGQATKSRTRTRGR